MVLSGVYRRRVASGALRAFAAIEVPLLARVLQLGILFLGRAPRQIILHMDHRFLLHLVVH
jgi:hypothetical protein